MEGDAVAEALPGDDLVVVVIGREVGDGDDVRHVTAAGCQGDGGLVAVVGGAGKVDGVRMVGGGHVRVGHVVGDGRVDLEAVFGGMDEEGEAVDAFLFLARGEGVAQGTGGHTRREPDGEAQAGVRTGWAVDAGDVFLGACGEEEGEEEEYVLFHINCYTLL